MRHPEPGLPASDRVLLLALIDREGLRSLAERVGVSSATLALAAAGSGTNRSTRAAILAAVAAPPAT